MYLALEEAGLINGTANNWNKRPYIDLEEENEKGTCFIIEAGRITGFEKENIPADHQSEQG